MYKICPKCGYQRAPTDSAPDNRCPTCGIYFDKWLKSRYRQALEADNPRTPERRLQPLWEGLRTWLFDYENPQDRLVCVGRLLLLIIFFAWGWQFILMDHRILLGGLPEINGSFLHGVNLVFHEAGHLIFSPFGRFVAVLGGSLGQLLIPALAIAAFLRLRDPFAASIGLWWLAQSTMDLAPYIYDARRGEMVLLGGTTGRDSPGFHDWSNILGDLGLLHMDHAIAAAVDGLGVLLMLSAYLWGGYVLWRNWR